MSCHPAVFGNCLTRAGVTVLGHLRDGHRWRAAVSLQSETRIQCLRLNKEVLVKMQLVLPGACREALGPVSSWRMENGFHSVIQEEHRDGIIFFDTPEWGPF